MNLFEWIKNKKILEKELDSLDRDLMLEKSKNNRLKKDNNFLQEQNGNYIDSIKELKKEIRKLKKIIKGDNNG